MVGKFCRDVDAEEQCHTKGNVVRLPWPYLDDYTEYEHVITRYEISEISGVEDSGAKAFLIRQDLLSASQCWKELHPAMALPTFHRQMRQLATSGTLLGLADTINKELGSHLSYTVRFTLSQHVFRRPPQG